MPPKIPHGNMLVRDSHNIQLHQDTHWAKLIWPWYWRASLSALKVKDVLTPNKQCKCTEGQRDLLKWITKCIPSKMSVPQCNNSLSG